MLISSIAEARSYRSFMVEVNRRAPRDGDLNIYGEGWDYTSVVFYRGEGVPALRGDLPSVEKKIRLSDGYFIMSEREWEKMAASGKLGLPLELKSRGTGPDGKDP